MEKISRIRSLYERWGQYRPTKTQSFWFGVGCVVATLVVGFGPGGWVIDGTTQQMVSKAATDARNQLAAAVCVEKFMDATQQTQAYA